MFNLFLAQSDAAAQAGYPAWVVITLALTSTGGALGLLIGYVQKRDYMRNKREERLEEKEWAAKKSEIERLWELYEKLSSRYGALEEKYEELERRFEAEKQAKHSQASLAQKLQSELDLYKHHYSVLKKKYDALLTASQEKKALVKK